MTVAATAIRLLRAALAALKSKMPLWATRKRFKRLWQLCLVLVLIVRRHALLTILERLGVYLEVYLDPCDW